VTVAPPPAPKADAPATVNVGLGNVGNWNFGSGNQGDWNLGNGNLGSGNVGSGNLGRKTFGLGNNGNGNVGGGNTGGGEGCRGGGVDLVEPSQCSTHTDQRQHVGIFMLAFRRGGCRVDIFNRNDPSVSALPTGCPCGE
jgi:PPE-repeat protein